MRKFKLEPIQLPESCRHILENIPPVHEPASVSSKHRLQRFWDANAIEKWRIPNAASSSLIRRIKEQTARRRNDVTFSLMQKVRESYVTKGTQLTNSLNVDVLFDCYIIKINKNSRSCPCFIKLDEKR